MKKSKIALIFKNASFPAMMTIISFVLFIGVYWLVTVKSIEPYYFEGLIFAVPFICFGIITFFTVKEKLKRVSSSIMTGVLIFLSVPAMLVTFTIMIFDAATTITTDISKYERVLNMSGYRSNSLIKHFPDKIPGSAKNIIFSYNPAFLQGGENFDLKFETDLDSIKSYINEFSQKAKWQGKASENEAEKNGVFSGTFNTFGYMDLPEDFTIYLIYSKPYKPSDWNHGELSLVAISQQRKEIIFLAEDW